MITEITEANPRTLAEAKVDRTSGVIRGTVLINATSANGPRGRVYEPKALRQIAEMAEGMVAYANHVPDPANAFKPRDVREIIGRHRNVRLEESRGRIMSDLHVLPNHRDWVFDLAEHMGDVVGNSIVSRGAIRVDAQGVQHVEEVLAVRSGDLVTDPATTKGLFEHREPQQEGTVKDRAKAAIAKHALGQRYGSIPAAISDVFVAQLAEAGEAAWPRLLDERVAVLDTVGATRRTEPMTESQTALSDPHARLAAALRGERYQTLADVIAEAADDRARRDTLREQRERDDAPEDAHTRLAEALDGKIETDAVPAGAHARLAAAIGGAR